ncbi:MAG: STAS domain-containing protein [Tissierellia bacterium]|nr:STAS domain-containing protein [Tissierellia bacterium]
MALDIKVSYNEGNNYWLVEPMGEVDIYTSSELKEKISEAIGDKKADIVIDGKKLDYLDSTGLGTLISIFKMIKDNENKIYIKNLKPNIRKLFEITELDKVFIIEE